MNDRASWSNAPLEAYLEHMTIRDKDRFKVRQGFVAEKGNMLIVGKYQQLEERIIGHLTGCKVLQDMFDSSNNLSQNSYLMRIASVRFSV